MADVTYPTVILDLGSCNTKVGLGTDANPRETCLSLCANKPGQSDPVCSWEAVKCSECQDFRHPIDRGVVRNWDDLKALCKHAICNVAGAKPSQHSLLVSQPPFASRASKEKIAQIMFEDLRVPYLHLENHDVLSLYSSGRTTGLVFGSGDGVTFISPIQDGFMIASQVKKLDVVGHDLTLRLAEKLNRQGCDFGSVADLVKVREIKEALCRVSTLDNNNYDAYLDATFELPDGQTISLGDDVFRIPETMFSPTDLESVGFPKAIFETVNKCDVSMRKNLYKNIILCGGNTLFPGFVERIDQELERLVPATSYAKTLALDDRANSVWQGGAILASLNTFQSLCMSRAQYDEYGPGVVHRKP